MGAWRRLEKGIGHTVAKCTAFWQPGGMVQSQYNLRCSLECVTNISHETLVGRWDAGMLLYNIKEQRPSPHQFSCVPWSRQIVTWGVTP